jgi:hypothetical protein
MFAGGRVKAIVIFQKLLSRALRKIAHFAPASQGQASHRNTSCAGGPARFGIFRGARKSSQRFLHHQIGEIWDF